MDEVYEFKKTLLERFDDISNIFSLTDNIRLSEIQKEWSNFLDIAMEPTGWRALWKIPRATCEVLKLRFPLSIIGTVEQVFYDELRASLKIEEVEDCGDDQNDHIPDTVDVNLIELFPTKYQENQALIIERTAEAIDSLRFFYQHIWRAWDSECDVDTNWLKYLETRIRFYFDVISNKMSKRLALHIKNLLEEAHYVYERKKFIEEEMDEEMDENNVKNSNVKELLHLHYRLKLLKNDLEMLENEEMRQVFESIKFMSNGDGCNSTKRFSLNLNETEKESGSTYIVSPEIEFGKLTSFISKLQINEQSCVSVHHSLAEVFERCSNVKQIYLAPGDHSLNFNENLFGKCKITGIDEKNSIITSKVYEATLLTLNGSFVIENVTFDCKSSSIGLVIAEGKTILRNCSFHGKPDVFIQEGIIIMAKASVVIENCTFLNFSNAIRTSKNSSVTINSVSIKESHIGIDLTWNPKSNLNYVKFQNVKQAILIPDLETSDIDIPSEFYAAKIIDRENLKISNISFTDVKENVVILKKTDSDKVDEQQMDLENL